MTEFSNIPWISDAKRPSWVQDDDLVRCYGREFKARDCYFWFRSLYYFPTDHPYSICAEYNARNPAKPQMVPWNPKRGEVVKAPKDSGGNVLLRSGVKCVNNEFFRWDNLERYSDIVGYVPKVSTSSLAGEPETVCSAPHNFSAGGEHSPVAGETTVVPSGSTDDDDENDYLEKSFRHRLKIRKVSTYNPETHAIIDKSTHGVYDLKTHCAVPKMTKSEWRDLQYIGGFSVWARESGIVIPDPDPIDTAAAKHNIPPDALRAALKELGK